MNIQIETSVDKQNSKLCAVPEYVFFHLMMLSSEKYSITLSLKP
jgi:hypothetical protein